MHCIYVVIVEQNPVEDDEKKKREIPYNGQNLKEFWIIFRIRHLDNL